MPLPQQEMVSKAPVTKEAAPQVNNNTQENTNVNPQTEGSAYPPLNTSGYSDIRRDR